MHVYVQTNPIVAPHVSLEMLSKCHLGGGGRKFVLENCQTNEFQNQCFIFTDFSTVTPLRIDMFMFLIPSIFVSLLCRRPS